MHPAFQIAATILSPSGSGAHALLCSASKSAAQPNSSRSMPSTSYDTPAVPSVPPLPSHSSIAWQAVIPPISDPEKLPCVLHTHFGEHFPSISAAKRVVRRGELLLFSNGEWRKATVLDRPRSQDVIARFSRVEMSSVKTRFANNSPALALQDDFVRFLDKERQIAVVVKPTGTSMRELREAIFFAVGDRSRRQEGSSQVTGAVLRRPVAVHRLDKVTGGLVVVALTDTAVRSLSQQFERREVCKTYRARVEGNLPVNQGTVRASVNSRPAETHFVVTDGGRDWTEVVLTPKTGRRHQLRVHMKELGHPILCDKLYGAKEIHPLFGQRRICLWAEKIAFRHPQDGRIIEVKADPPSSLFGWVQTQSINV